MRCADGDVKCAAGDVNAAEKGLVSVTRRDGDGIVDTRMSLDAWSGESLYGADCRLVYELYASIADCSCDDELSCGLTAAAGERRPQMAEALLARVILALALARTSARFADDAAATKPLILSWGPLFGTGACACGRGGRVLAVAGSKLASKPKVFFRTGLPSRRAGTSMAEGR